MKWLLCILHSQNGSTKADKYPTSHFSPFNCCFVAWRRGSPWKFTCCVLSKWIAFFLTFRVFGSCAHRHRRRQAMMSQHESKEVKMLVEVLLYIHRNHRFSRDGSPGHPPQPSRSSWALREVKVILTLPWLGVKPMLGAFTVCPLLGWCVSGRTGGNSPAWKRRKRCSPAKPMVASSTVPMKLWYALQILLLIFAVWVFGVHTVI